MDISRKGFLKLLGFGALGVGAGLGLKIEAKDDTEKVITNKQEIQEIKIDRRAIEVFNENDGWYKSWFRFPIVKTLTSKERESSWIQVVAADKNGKELVLLEVPTIFVDKNECKFYLGIPVVGAITAYLHGE
jgi:hypothetical protein